jgi:GT2 family glycosyltransferase/glycosyltransferase involved in cell wall biosynthesis
MDRSLSSLEFDRWAILRLVGIEDLAIYDPDENGYLNHEEIWPSLPNNPNPEISIIIATHNKLGYLFNCLQTIKICCKSLEEKYEIIVVDDGSTDEASRCLFEIQGIRLHRLDNNVGYLKANNAGARLAKGEYIVLLNNDTLVTPGWLDALIETLRQDDDVGAVGSKLVHPTGELQEAGSIIWNDGRIWNYGRSEDPLKAEYQYAREVDYCSGASLAIKRSSLRPSGLYDEQFAPAYYEDVDLCLYLQSVGKAVIYQPRSVVVHYEGVSRNVSHAGVMRLVEANREKLVKKWKHELSGHLPPDPINVAKASTRKGNRRLRLTETSPNNSSGIAYRTTLILSRSVEVIRTQGLRCFLNQTREKLARREFSVFQPVVTIDMLSRSVPSAQVETRALPSQSLATRSTLIFGANLSGYFRGRFGLGASGRAFAEALELARIPHSLNNLESPHHRSAFAFDAPFSKANPYAINIVHVNADHANLFFHEAGPGYSRRKYNIGIWYWELSRFPKIWSTSFRFYNELWSTSSFTTKALSEVTTLPVVKIRYPLFRLKAKSYSESRKRFPFTDDKCIFLFIFDFHSVIDRKNPQGLLNAFRKAFDRTDKALLVLNYINGNANPKGVRLVQKMTKGLSVEILDGHLSQDDYLALMSASDCYVSLHRSEGFGVPMAEAMSLGKPVIATGYSGNMDFMNSNNSLIVGYELKELEKDYGPYKKGNVWAEPDVEQAAQHMRWVYANREKANSIGARAEKEIKETLNPEVAAEEIRRRLECIFSQSFN